MWNFKNLKETKMKKCQSKQMKNYKGFVVKKYWNTGLESNILYIAEKESVSLQSDSLKLLKRSIDQIVEMDI